MAHHHHHREPAAVEAPLDAANQSLSDALRSSFNILKLIMVVLVIAFLLTGVQSIDDREEAVVLQFGRLVDTRARPPGLSLAWPYPIHETLRVPVRQDNIIEVDDHFVALTDQEKERPLSRVNRATLDPVEDGALLTGDNGLVHVRWRLVYRIEDLIKFLTTVADGGTAQAEALISAMLDNAAIHEAVNYSAEEITRAKAGELAARVRTGVNERLTALNTGIRVIALDIPQSTVPLATLKAFQAVSSAENNRQKLIREAEQERSRILNECAGEAHPRILAALDRWETARATGGTEAAESLQTELDRLIQAEAGGAAATVLSEARSYFTNAVQAIRADEEEYNALLAEYLRAPDLLFARLWTQTKRKIYNYESVEKYHLSPGQKEVRIVVGPDPKQRMLDEMKRIARQETNGE